jgi:hypothetical protein
MTRFLVEAYLPQQRATELPTLVRRLRAVAGELSSDGTPVRHLRSTFVPEDETCFHLFEGASAEAVREAGRRAALGFDRIMVAI